MRLFHPQGPSHALGPEACPPPAPFSSDPSLPVDGARWNAVCSHSRSMAHGAVCHSNPSTTFSVISKNQKINFKLISYCFQMTYVCVLFLCTLVVWWDGVCCIRQLFVTYVWFASSLKPELSCQIYFRLCIFDIVGRFLFWYFYSFFNFYIPHRIVFYRKNI